MLVPRPTHPHPLQSQSCSCSFPQREPAPAAPAENFSVGGKSRDKHFLSSLLAPEIPALPHSEISDRTAQSLPAVRTDPVPPGSRSSPSPDPPAPPPSLPSRNCVHGHKDCYTSHT